MLQENNYSGDDVTRSLPHAVGPEKSLLSSMMQEPQEYIALAIEERLTVDHFYMPAHALLFGVLVEFFEKNQEIEIVSLIQILIDRDLLARVGGPSALSDLYTYAPSPGHFRNHLQFVKDKYVLRSIIKSSNQAISRAYESPEEASELLDYVESEVLAIREKTDAIKSGDIKNLVESVTENFRRLITSTDEKIHGIKTGFNKLDQMTGGLKEGEMFVLAARPSMGKTSLMMNIVENICIDQGLPGMVFSCEMTSLQLAQRLVFGRARFSLSQISRGYRPNKSELSRIQISCMDVASSKLIIDDSSGISINELRAKARRIKRDEGIRFIAIDYLQLMKSGTRQAKDSREREIAEISAGIKGLAKELKIPILILAQLNRGPESRSGKNIGVPRMSDLRESGAIEQDADYVGLLYRASYYAETEEERSDLAGNANLVLAKNRNGETGDIEMSFTSGIMRFEDAQN